MVSWGLFGAPLFMETPISDMSKKLHNATSRVRQISWEGARRPLTWTDTSLMKKHERVEQHVALLLQVLCTMFREVVCLFRWKLPIGRGSKTNQKQ